MLPFSRKFPKFATAVHGAPQLIFALMEQVNTPTPSRAAFLLQREAIRAEHPHFYEFWTFQDMNRMRELFLDGMRIDEIARVIGRTPQGVRKKLMSMGEICCFRGREGQPWSFDEELRLQRMLGQGYSTSETARLIGRKSDEILAHLKEAAAQSE